LRRAAPLHARITVRSMSGRTPARTRTTVRR
jgi:hypothetical protein